MEVPIIPSLGSVNFLEWLTELRESLYLLDCWFTLEGYLSGTGRGKRCTGQGVGEKHRVTACSAGAPLSLPFHVATRSSSAPILGVFRKASPLSHDSLKHWPLVIELKSPAHPPSPEMRGGDEGSNHLKTQSVPLASSPHL